MSGVVIRPLRFTNDVEAMCVFLETLGLRPRIESERGVWFELLAGRGMVALHDAASSSTGGQHGQTDLAFESEDVDALKERLESAGYDDATVFDEAFGRVLSLTGPDGQKIWIDERSKDLYGYKRHESSPDERWSVTPGLAVADQAGWERFLRTLGVESPVYFVTADDFEVQLELTTTEGLDDVERRMTGYQVTRAGGRLEIVDPDGRLVVVHG
ncbi:VOC family protein [Kribbella turkmenica]|uniref:VOC family protein n=1 Tax=Kribbella turkmenica TaxID=2530375 RepID=A0A4R4WF49_9ACTN|nr:VOC family protein [Kribbella turkmenica]TDD17579.1 VOC family protein [Kribbella turkmenica]